MIAARVLMKSDQHNEVQHFLSFMVPLTCHLANRGRNLSGISIFQEGRWHAGALLPKALHAPGSALDFLLHEIAAG